MKKPGARLLDSSVWIELFTEGPLSPQCESYHKSSKLIIVPTLVLYEVYKKIHKSVSEEMGMSAVGFLCQNDVVDLNKEVALTAADLSLTYNLAMADSLILAQARLFQAELVTLDNDFAKVPEVKVLR